MLWYVYQTLRIGSERPHHWIDSIGEKLTQSPVLLLLILILSGVNWALEILKWQYLHRLLQPTSFGEALRSVMMGTTLSYLTPASVGDYAGKLLHTPAHLRIQGTGMAVVGNGIQFWVALFFGTVAFAKFTLQLVPSAPNFLFLLALVLATLGAFLLLRYWKHLHRGFQRIPFLNRYTSFFEAFNAKHTGLHSQILGLSTIRYLVFTLQFVFSMMLFELQLSTVNMLMISALVFFAKTVIPSFNFLSDLGVREFSALYFCAFFGMSPQAVVASTLLLWLINVFVPMLMGTYFLIRLRLNPS